jgi:hypothetical protein
MAKHKGLPKAAKRTFSKAALLRTLSEVDVDAESRSRVLAMETEFRRRVSTHIGSLPTSTARFSKFNTNPFVVLIHSMKKGYRQIAEIEQDILPAKLFSSMETSAGRMVEAVVLPAYGWEVVASAMHSSESVVDGKRRDGDVLRLASLKSGPRCLNDEMSKDIAQDILNNSSAWATLADVKEIDFTYGVLYGTQRQSNKKDWHILRNIAERLPASCKLTIDPSNLWHCEFRLRKARVRATVRIGIDLYDYIAGHRLAFVEICAALIRACIVPSDVSAVEHRFTIVDLAEIISIDGVGADYNVGILQRSQLEWLFFVARHFCDELLADEPKEGG